MHAGRFESDNVRWCSSESRAAPPATAYTPRSANGRRLRSSRRRSLTDHSEFVQMTRAGISKACREISDNDPKLLISRA